MNLGDNDVVIGMQISSQGKDMLIVSEKGNGQENVHGRIHKTEPRRKRCEVL